MSATVPARAPSGVPVWDPLLRLAHWTLAFSVLAAIATGDDGGKWHERLGYVALGVVAIRLAWGWVGPARARFADFVRSPREVLDYTRRMIARSEPRHLGHNPLGGAWIVVMLALVAATGVTGWALAILGEDEFEWIEDLHEGLANGLIGALVVHLAGVAWASLRHGENLVAAMLTGRKRAPRPGDD